MDMERERGFEPPTPSLARMCSAAELLPLELRRAEGQNRTGDTGVFSAVLYRLSYLGPCLSYFSYVRGSS